MNDIPEKEEEPLAALFEDVIPDSLTNDMLALAHLSDVEEEDMQIHSGPIRRQRQKKASNPYGRKKKSEQEEWNDQMKELDFRAKAWKPFSKTNDKGK